MNLYTLDSENQDLLRRATELSSVPHGRKDYFPNAFGMPTRDYWSISGLKTGAAADALRAAISLQLSSAPAFPQSIPHQMQEAVPPLPTPPLLTIPK